MTDPSQSLQRLLEMLGGDPAASPSSASVSTPPFVAPSSMDPSRSVQQLLEMMGGDPSMVPTSAVGTTPPFVAPSRSPSVQIGVASPQPTVPMVAPSSPIGAPSKGGIDWKALLQMVAPVVGGLATHGTSQTGFLQGMAHGQELARQHKEEKQKQEEAKAAASGRYVLGINDKLSGIEDPADFAAMRDLASQHALTESDKQQIASIQYSPTKATKTKLKKISDRLDALDKTTEGGLQPLVDSGAYLRLDDGTQISVDAAMKMTGRGAVDASGKPVTVPRKGTHGFTKVEKLVDGKLREINYDGDTGKYTDPDTGAIIPSQSITRYEKPPTLSMDERAAALLGDVQTATAKGDTATASAKRAEYDRIVQAKKDMNAAGRNPEMDALNLSMKQLQLDALRTKAKETGTGFEVKPGSREERIAQQLGSGDLTFSDFSRLLGARSAQTIEKKLAIYDKAMELNPEFKPAAYEMGYKFASSPKVQAQIASVNNVLSGVPDLLAASDAAKRSGVTALNKFVMPGGVAMGGKRYTDFKTAQIAFADELSGALGYGSATDMSREMGFNMTDPSMSPDNFRSAVQTIIVPFVKRKKASMQGQMGPYGGDKAPDTSGGGDATSALAVLEARRKAAGVKR